ncbi:hypothetical protein C8J57DRAFT_1497270 [Mycena rebaudengoi]|nr:hypothetical protein C8J57DRAFT_1497270 [Mycena rebaudengoi]
MEHTDIVSYRSCDANETSMNPNPSRERRTWKRQPSPVASDECLHICVTNQPVYPSTALSDAAQAAAFSWVSGFMMLSSVGADQELARNACTVKNVEPSLLRRHASHLSGRNSKVSGINLQRCESGLIASAYRSCAYVFSDFQGRKRPIAVQPRSRLAPEIGGNILAPPETPIVIVVEVHATGFLTTKALSVVEESVVPTAKKFQIQRSPRLLPLLALLLKRIAALRSLERTASGVVWMPSRQSLSYRTLSLGIVSALLPMESKSLMVVALIHVLTIGAMNWQLTPPPSVIDNLLFHELYDFQMPKSAKENALAKKAISLPTDTEIKLAVRTAMRDQRCWGTERSESDLVEMADAALLDVALDYRDCGLLVQPCPLKQVEDVMHVGVAEAVERDAVGTEIQFKVDSYDSVVLVELDAIRRGKTERMGCKRVNAGLNTAKKTATVKDGGVTKKR